MARGASFAIGLVVMAICAGSCSDQEPVLETLPPLPRQTPLPLVSATPLISVGNPTQPAGTGVPSPVSIDTAAYVQGATTTLATTLNVPESSIAFLNITPQQWPDTSLGCPQPDQTYEQVITPGYLITFKVDEATYEVHSDLNQHFVVCLNGSGAGATPTPPDPIVAEFIMEVKQDLASQLGIPPDDVVVVSSEAVDWTDGSLGCKPGKGTAYPPEVISGYRIVLAVGDKYYEYHTSFDIWIRCKEPTQ